MSRYDEQHEINDMASALEWTINEWDRDMAGRIYSIFCHSKAECDYTVKCRAPVDIGWVLEAFKGGFMKTHGGYNGITVECDGLHADSNWNEPEETT